MCVLERLLRMYLCPHHAVNKCTSYNRTERSFRRVCREYHAYPLISRGYSDYYSKLFYTGMYCVDYSLRVNFFIDKYDFKEEYASYKIFCLEEFPAYE